MCFNTCSSCEEQRSEADDGVFGDVSIHAPLARSNSFERALAGWKLNKFQYMLLLRGATRTQTAIQEIQNVSIHAPLARSNRALVPPFPAWSSFNTCSSCEEQPRRFRHPTRRVCFNTCSSCEEQQGEDATLTLGEVSIHAPLARSNLSWRGNTSLSSSFNTCSSCEEQPVTVSDRYGKPRFNTCSSCEEQPPACVFYG